jgi:drug/metabolite transporter (DMT)-like permease
MQQMLQMHLQTVLMGATWPIRTLPSSVYLGAVKMSKPSGTKAVLWMLGWFGSMLFMTWCGREATRELPVNMLMFFRSAIGMVILLPIVAWSGFGKIQTGQLVRHGVRSCFHFAAQFGWFLALTLIPLAQVVSIEFTMPIWAAVIASFYLGEKISAMRVVAIVLGFIGVLVIVRPGMATVSPGQLLALASAFGFAASVVITKRLLEQDSAFTVLFYMIGVQLVLGGIIAMFFWQWPNAQAWPFVIGAGVAGLTSHYSLARALVLSDSATIAQMDFARVPLTAMLGFLVYHEKIGIFLVIGAGLIISGNMINLRRG